MSVIQVSWVPPGIVHRAPVQGSLRDAVELAAAHFVTHSEPGGFVGIAPLGRGFIVQLHAADGHIEAFRILRNASKNRTKTGT